jgi:hypothetical protein
MGYLGRRCVKLSRGSLLGRRIRRCRFLILMQILSLILKANRGLEGRMMSSVKKTMKILKKWLNWIIYFHY